MSLASEEHGDLTDDHAWGVMRGVMKDAVTDAVLFTPGTLTFRDQDSDITPAMRGHEGSDLHGLATAPDWANTMMQHEDLQWIRTVKAADELTEATHG